MSELQNNAVESLKMLTTSLVDVTRAVKELLEASMLMRDRIITLEKDVQRLKLKGESYTFEN